MTHIHINRPRGHYVGQVRDPYCKTWRTVTGRCRSGRSALAKAVLHARRYNMKARALLIDRSYYYEPIVVGEAKL